MRRRFTYWITVEGCDCREVGKVDVLDLREGVPDSIVDEAMEVHAEHDYATVTVTLRRHGHHERWFTVESMPFSFGASTN